MDLLRHYSEADDSDSDAEDVSSQQKPVPVPKSAASVSKALVSINSAPVVDLQLHQLEAAQGYVDPSTKILYHNPTADQMWQPVLGPQPSAGQPKELKNMVSGFIEKAAFDDASFFEQYHSFNTKGVALNPSVIGADGPSGDGVIRRIAFATTIAPPEDTTDTDKPASSSSSSAVASSSDAKGASKSKRKHRGDPGSVDGYLGPWAPFEGEVFKQENVTDQMKAYAEKYDARNKKRREQREQREQQQQKEQKEKLPDEGPPETTEFHGDFELDYQGRSYMHFPEHLIKKPEKNFVPKQVIHTYAGHTKGVAAIRFLPRSGHLLLSASMDTTIKIWGVAQSNRKLLRTYSGHTHPLRDICFNKDGSRFLSASFDKYIKLWDTETGKCISKHTTGKLPYCVKFHPDKNNECLAGQQNKKIVQWSLDSNEVTCEYDEHLGPVNTVTFIDENRRFVSTSDDKKVFIWEYGIPVVIKHHSEPDMQSMPYVEVHPDGKYWCGQSLDNQILVYSTQRGFKMNKRKRFRGHHNAGYAPQISFSPDGKLVSSGSGDGRVFFWDWTTTRIFGTIKAHDKVAIGCIWHPIEPSRVATCSWDGLIKLWD